MHRLGDGGALIASMGGWIDGQMAEACLMDG